MDFRKFEKLVKKINKNKYHISRVLKFTVTGEPYIDCWSIFRKDMMSTEEYFDPKNLAVLSSKKGDTLNDIEKLIKEEN